MKFELHADFSPTGDQPRAIEKLARGLDQNHQFQTLLGVTGSGKTFTMANVIEKVQKPTLVLAHNKTLAAQLYSEFKEFFPKNRVEYFVSYYDYYQPESYIPQKDQYIEKDSQVNARIEQMRLSATASLVQRPDTLIVSSISCIYGLGNPETFVKLGTNIELNQKLERKDLLIRLIDMQYERNDTELMPGRFRVKGSTIDLIPGYYNNIIRIEFFSDEIERITEIEKTSGKVLEQHKYYQIYPARHFVIEKDVISRITQEIEKELEEHLPKLGMMEAHRLRQRTLYDIEMLQETGFCKGIENYSRFFDGRKHGERPYTLLDYFPDDFLFIIDESHQSLPQARGMYKGDRSRKKNLVDYGFRLPSAYDNRPLKFDELEHFFRRVVFVSATPGDYELEHSRQVAEQIIRPTGLVDPIVEIRPIKDQIPDLIKEINATIEKGNRILVTTLTKKLAEELTDFLAEKKIKTRYLHSEVDTLDRTEIIRQLRLGKFDVLVGINLLREGLDIPEVSFIGILDADKEGFLRDARSLIQTIGRAARNSESKVVLYADNITGSIKDAIAETNRRRQLQLDFNREHNITPKTIVKPIRDKEVEVKDTKHIPKSDIPNVMIELEAEMAQAADALEFERAIDLRDKIKRLKDRLQS